MKDYSKLFERTSIGKVRLRNRLAMSSMGTFAEDADGLLVESQYRYYAERAKGGLGLLILEGQFVTNITDPIRENQKGIDTEQQMQHWAQAAQAVHAYGAKVALQVHCGLGRNAAIVPGGRQPTSSSATPCIYDSEVVCRPLTVEEIHAIVESHARAADRAVRAGMDMIEINAHCGYLLDQFMTPLWNHRTDEYGGSFENRMRFITEIYQAMRNVVGPDFPIIIRYAAWHDFEGARTLEEGIEIAQYFAQIGVDALDINLGCYDNKIYAPAYVYLENGYALPYAEAIRKAVNIPILNAGKHTPDTALEGVEKGQVDIVLLGRPVIADPQWANKLRAGRSEDIRPCMSCSQMCIGSPARGLPSGCAVNAISGMEKEYPLTKTASPKKVVVVGGGPGGMEAARVAALKGHTVTLYEKSNELGGQMNVACVPKFRYRVGLYRDWQIRQLKKLGVNIVMNHAIEATSLELAAADQIIVALGAVPMIVPIKGYEQTHVVEVTDSHRHPEKVKGEKVVIAGGGMSGCDCAIELAMEGKQVTIVEMAGAVISKEPADEIFKPVQIELKRQGVTVMLNTKVLEFKRDSVAVENADGVSEIPADTIITAFGMKPEIALTDAICEKYPTAISVGDCNGVGGQIGQAVHDGYFAAWSIE